MTAIPPGFVPVPPPSHKLWNAGIVAAVVAVVAVLVLAGLFVVPFPHSFSFEMTGTGGPSGYNVAENRSFPSGSYVYGSWSSTCTGVTVFDIWSGQPSNLNPPVYSSNTLFGPSGAFTFRSNGNPYLFEFSCGGDYPQVNVSGTYSMPLL